MLNDGEKKSGVGRKEKKKGVGRKVNLSTSLGWEPKSAVNKE